MEENEKRIKRLLKITFVLLGISLIGGLLVIRENIIGEEGMLYTFGVVIGLSGGIFGTVICSYVAGLKASIKSKG